MKKILVIEDDQKHLENAKTLVEKFPEFDFTFATTLCEALTHEVNMQKIRQFDAVITDLHFPLDKGYDPQQIGISIAMFARFLGKPVAIVSDMDRHGRELKLIREIWLNLNAGWNLGQKANFPLLIHDIIPEWRVEYLSQKYELFRDIYSPGQDGIKPYDRVLENLIAYWKE